VKALKFGPPEVILQTKGRTVVAREVLRPMNLRDGKKDPIGATVDTLLNRHGELESKDAPETTKEIELTIGIYSYGKKPKQKPDGHLKFWLDLKKELKKTLKTPRKIVWGSWAD
jgi:hypothetical protein